MGASVGGSVTPVISTELTETPVDLGVGAGVGESVGAGVPASDGTLTATAEVEEAVEVPEEAWSTDVMGAATVGEEDGLAAIDWELPAAPEPPGGLPPGVVQMSLAGGAPRSVQPAVENCAVPVEPEMLVMVSVTGSPHTGKTLTFIGKL